MVEISLKSVNFSYRSTDVLNNITFDIQSGTVFTLAGPNGSGKTTLLKCMNRILIPSGDVLIDQIDLLKMEIPDIARKIGYVSQFFSYTPGTTVFDAVLMGRRCHMGCFPKKTDYEVVSNILSQMKLETYAMKHVDELSGGQRQRVHIGRAMAQNPDYLLLDEPISSLDLKHQIEVLELLRNLAHIHGITVIMALHDLNLATRYSDSLALLKDGTIHALGDPGMILTPEAIETVYSVETELIRDRNGNPYVIPVRAM